MEPLSSTDAVLWHLEKAAPMHTLKVAVLDPSGRGRPLTLGDVRATIRAHLDRYPPASRIVDSNAYGRPYWVRVPEIDLDRHLDEATAESPGSRRQFDAALSRAAGARMALDGPLWQLTLLHGLEQGRQALVVRIHHTLTDGSAAAAAFEGLTTATPGGEPEMAAVPPLPAGLQTPGRVAGRALALRAVRAGRVLSEAVAGSRKAATFRAARGSNLPPPGLAAYRDTFLWGIFGEERVAATACLPLADFRTVSKRSGHTINGVLHAVMARALREERLRRGEDPQRPIIAAFGIALDAPGGPPRRWGNNITPTYVSLHTGPEDPRECLERTALSAREAVELRRTAGPDFASRLGDLVPQMPSAAVRRLRRWIPSSAHLVTANVRGPAATRWLGGCEVVDWYSISCIPPPVPLNITVYSYAGEMKVGLLATPEVIGDPYPLLDGMAVALAELLDATA